ncbi:hypothetical protein CCACVL1_28816, partial [Corchorus capsularis]
MKLSPRQRKEATRGRNKHHRAVIRREAK